MENRPDGFGNLRRVMEESPPPPVSRSAGGRASNDVSSRTSRMFQFVSWLKGIPNLKSTLQRPFNECRDAVTSKMNELGVSWKDEGRGYTICEYGQRGTLDYVEFSIQWVTNGASSPSLPGAEMWYTKIYINKVSGSGQAFRDIGKQVLNAAKYTIQGGVRHDFSITTWGLF
ncbi:unnamed protein product [Clonostachys solani]|uniref:Uncharacterized protein n=1 Tax=Clonostachys solani TaxID=160281 RepID=A0A9N9Z2N6_9HYPO|nr:unnamed protein product [Clonostachys solani]